MSQKYTRVWRAHQNASQCKQTHTWPKLGIDAAANAGVEPPPKPPNAPPMLSPKLNPEAAALDAGAADAPKLGVLVAPNPTEAGVQDIRKKGDFSALLSGFQPPCLHSEGALHVLENDSALSSCVGSRRHNDITVITSSDVAPAPELALANVEPDSAPNAGMLVAAPNAGVDAAPKVEVIAPKAGADAAPKAGVDAAPKLGVEADPKAGVEAAPNAGADVAPKAEDVLGVAPKAGAEVPPNPLKAGVDPPPNLKPPPLDAAPKAGAEGVEVPKVAWDAPNPPACPPTLCVRK